MEGRLPIRAFAATIALAACLPASAGTLDAIGFTALRSSHPELAGAGQIVAQAEAPVGSAYQANPVSLGQSASLFHYYDGTNPYGTAGTPFSTSLESPHADTVGGNLYSATGGGSPGVQSVENFDANYFYNDVVANLVTVNSSTTWQPVAIAAPIVNQSFIFTNTASSDIAEINFFYDAYASRYGTLFVNALNNGTSTLTNAPASSYDGIAVGDSDNTHSGRAQIVAPGGETSFATPYVTAAAVVLRQAAAAGDFQALSGTSATDARVLKVGLLAGATKIGGWTHTSTDPLDATSGAGLLNVNNSFNILAGGQHTRSLSSRTALNAVSIPTSISSPIPALDGWDLSSLTAKASMGGQDAVNHYFFDLRSDASLSLTAALTWDSIVSLSAGTDLINNFDLILVNVTSQSIVWSSASTTQNVEYIYLQNLQGAEYDLQVILHGGSATPALTDTYALAWSWNAGPTPVPESKFTWLIGFAGLVFIARKRLLERRHPQPN